MTTTRTPDVVAGLTTDWLPLTTPGPGPINVCSTAIYYLPGATSRFVAFDPYYGKWIDPNVKCLAAEQSLWWNQHSDGGVNNINLGPFACPSGYTTASVSTMNAFTSFVGCCPSAYKFMGSFFGAATIGQCQSPLSVGQTIVAKSAFQQLVDWKDTTAVITTTSMSVTAVHINGFIFRDAADSTPASAPASTTQAGTTPTATSAIASSTATGASAPSSGLSSGAKIGLGVGVSLGFLAICAIIFMMIMFKRRSNQRKSVLGPGVFEAPSHPADYPMAKHGVGNPPIYEAPGNMEDSGMMAGKYRRSPGNVHELSG